MSDLLYVHAMRSVNGSAFAKLTNLPGASAVTGGTAHASVQSLHPLEPGKTYVFAAAFASNSALTVSPGYCRGVVLIVKTTVS